VSAECEICTQTEDLSTATVPSVKCRRVSHLHWMCGACAVVAKRLQSRSGIRKKLCDAITAPEFHLHTSDSQTDRTATPRGQHRERQKRSPVRAPQTSPFECLQSLSLTIHHGFAPVNVNGLWTRPPDCQAALQYLNPAIICLPAGDPPAPFPCIKRTRLRGPPLRKPVEGRL
jgi:hypothetical protein